MNTKVVAQELLKVAKMLTAAPNKERIDAKVRSHINKELAEISTHNGATRYEKIPLDATFAVLKKYGVVPLDVDRTHWSGFLLGHEGRANIHLGRDVGKGPNEIHSEFVNSQLVMTWYNEGDAGSKYEYICYLS